MAALHAVFAYLRNRQSPKILILHLCILVGVLSQITVSNFIHFSHSGAISGEALYFYGTWIHILTGLILLPLALIFTLTTLWEHGWRYFYPYLVGDHRQASSDIVCLRRRELPPPEAGGLAAIVKGLGLIALLAVLLSGLSWFVAWKLHFQWSHSLRDLHALLASLIEVYVVGHGGMGLLHIYLVSHSQEHGI